MSATFCSLKVQMLISCKQHIDTMFIGDVVEIFHINVTNYLSFNIIEVLYFYGGHSKSKTSNGVLWKTSVLEIIQLEKISFSENRLQMGTLCQ